MSKKYMDTAYYHFNGNMGATSLTKLLGRKMQLHWRQSNAYTTNVKNMHPHRDSNPGPWITVPML